MRLPLLRKELREQRPFLLFSLFFTAVELLDAAQRGLDALPLSQSLRSSCDESTVLVMVLGFALGTGLLVREQDEGTLAFLEGLPVSRARLFGAKLLVGWALVVAYPSLRVLLLVGLHLWGRSSLDHALHLPILLSGWALSALLTFSALAVGLWLGFFRSLAWFVLAMLLTGLTLAQRELPALAALNPAEVCELRLVGDRVDFDAGGVLGPLGLGLVALGLAWAMFTGVGRGLQRSLAGLSGRPVLSALVVMATLGGAVALAVAWDDKLSSHDRPKDGDAPRFSRGAPGLRETRHFRFHYPSARAGLALALADRGDAVFEEVHRLMAAPLGGPIDVDLSGSTANTSGTTFQERVRLELDGEEEETLAHETAHVVARRLAGAKDAANLDHLVVLNEGLAHWVGRRFRKHPTLDADRLVAAALHARGEVLMDELLDARLLARNRDGGAKYVLGASLVDVLVEQHGADAPRRVFEAAGAPTLRTDLGAVALNQAVFQLAGIDLALVVDALFQRLADDARALEQDLAKLPRPRAELYRGEGGWFGVLPVLDGPVPAGWTLVVRFRPRADSAPRDYQTLRPDPGEPAWRHASKLARGEVCFQPGLASRGRASLYEPWTCLSAKTAVEWRRAAATRAAAPR